MPYTNMPKNKVAEMDSCVKQVMAGKGKTPGKPKKNAIAICYASIMGKEGEKKKDAAPEDFVLDPASLDPALLVEGMDVDETEDEMGKSLDDLKQWVKDQFAATREMFHLKHEAGSDHTMAVHSDKTKKCPKCGKWVEPKGGKCSECDAVMKEMSDGAIIYKDVNTGAYRWLAVFTNKFRDRDNPPEIICDAAHQDFVKAVNSGEWPMPEYRLWHIKVPIGRTDYLAYHDAGFAVASGTITKGLEPVAEMMREASFRWINSHGMPVGEIRREDPDDKTVITRYRSKEITALPEWAAANELTFNFLEDEMAGFTDKDRNRLTRMFGDKAVEVENLLTNVGEKATLDGVESKDKDAPPAVLEAPVESLAETPDMESPAPYPTRDEVADVLKPLAEAVSQLTAAVTDMQNGMKELRTALEQKDRDVLASTPSASLAELVMASVTKGKPNEARLKGRAGTSMSGPKETPVPASPEAQTGFRKIPFLAELTKSGGAIPAEGETDGQ